VTTSGDATLVLDEHLTAMQNALKQRGLDALKVHDFHATSTLDPDVIRAVEGRLRPPWVLVTMDGTIVDEHPTFEWGKYAIAWVLIEKHLKGVAVEHAKADVVQKHAHRVVEQRAGDHFTYTKRAQFKHPPSLVSARSR
jgi:hypothetical protein